MDAVDNFSEVLTRFVSLGGIATNITQREGKYGRGIFSIDSSRKAKIMSPMNLFVEVTNLSISSGELFLTDKTGYTVDEVSFLETYYNDFSWGNNGNSDSISFLGFISSLKESTKNQLVSNRFLPKQALNTCESEQTLLNRFIGERVVRFGGKSVLAPVWEFVNHSSFSAPLRIESYGVETPPVEPSTEEIFFKYSEKNSPIGMWAKYGFACKCIVSYSIPFVFQVSNHSLYVSCSGEFGSSSHAKAPFSVVGNTLVIPSLPIGCMSTTLAWKNLVLILSSIGFSKDIAENLFPKIIELNLNARRDLIDNLSESAHGSQSPLYNALKYEIDLIEASSIGKNF